jgi:hypothetical protein
LPPLRMYEGGRARQDRTGVSARFADHNSARDATRALQRQLGLRPEQVSVALAAGVDANEIEGRGGYIGITKAGAVIVHARGYDPSLADQVRAALEKAGGTLVVTAHSTVSTGGYGPTTANGTRGVIGDTPGTSAMANHLFTVGAEPVQEEGQKT